MFGAQVSGFRGCVILWGGYFFRAWGFGVLTCHYGSMYPILDVPLLLLPSKSEPYLGGGGGGGAWCLVTECMLHGLGDISNQLKLSYEFANMS